MKNIFKTTLSLALALCLLLGTIPAVGALWDFSNGVPSDWEQQNTLEEFRAEHLLNTVNPNSSQEAKNLLAYIQLVGDSQQCIGGQFDISNDNLAYNEVVEDYGYEPTLYSARYFVDSTEPTWKLNGDGKETAIITNTCMDFPDIDAVNELFLDHYNNGNILMVHSDSAPRSLCAAAAMKNKPDVYQDATDAIIELDATNPDRDMQAYALWMKYQAGVIEGLTRLEALGVKAYLWRPWIEYNNHVFCGRTAEGYDAFARVYQQTVNMLIDAGLTGFLVTFSPNLHANILPHNPGTDYVDIYGFTAYSNSDKLGYLVGSDSDSTSIAAIRRCGKPLGFTEFSCRTGAWQEIDKQARASSFDLLRSSLSYWPELAFFNYWGNGSYDTGNSNFDEFGNDDGRLFWSSDYVITLDEAVDYRQGVIQAPGIAQLFTTADASGKYVGLEERAYSNAALKKMGIDPAAVRSVRLNQGFTVTFWTGDNCTGDYYRLGFSKKGIPADMAKNFKSLSIGSLENVALDQTEIYASVNDTGAWRMNDGFATVWEGDVFDAKNDAEPGTAWVYIDLGKPYHVGRYVLKNASFANRPEMYNTVDFQLQYSNDFEKWTTVDTVTDNTLGQVNRYISPVMAQYFRLVITDPNACVAETEQGVVIVSELELYGVDPGLYEEEEPTPPTTKPTTVTTTKKPTTTTTKKPTTTTAVKLSTPKVTASNATKGIKVSWNKVSKADKYYVYRRLYSSGKWGSWSKIKTTTAVSYTDEAAKAGKNYQYMVKAVKGSVTSGYKATATITRLGVPKVKASNATKGIKVSWGKVTGATSYRVYRRLYSSGKWGSWSKIKTTTAVSYTDEAAKAGKNYQYMVKAVKGDSVSYYKATATITRLGVPKVKASNATKGIKVTWGKVTGATSYRVYRRLYSSGKWGSWSKIKTVKTTSYTDTGAKTGKNYQYMVKAVKGDSTSYYKATATIRRLKAPGSVKLKKATKGFKVSWSKVTGATKYEVYRRTGSGSWSKVASTSKTGYTDKAAKKGKYYTYRVRAVYSSSKSVFKTGSKTKR